ncbi:hypothetical protein CUMW_245460, partial [Citrus unshiu]
VSKSEFDLRCSDEKDLIEKYFVGFGIIVLRLITPVVRRVVSKSAITDPEVKGGLRRPMGKSYSGQRYRVIGVWHTEFKSYKSPSLKLKVRNADRFDFKTATGEATIEINLKLRRIVSEIQDGKIDTDSVYSGQPEVNVGSFLVMRAAFDMNNRLQALPYSGLMFAFGCILYLLLWKDCEVNIITMAYIPPNLRRSKDPQRPSPVPEMLEPIFNRKLKLGSSKHDAGASTNCIEYGDHAVHRSFVCGLDNNKSISSDHFEEVPEEPDEQKRSVTINLATAIPDPKVKGGLRWPVGKSYSGNYTVVGVWHNEFKSYKSPSLKLKVRNVDRFLFKAGTGVATIEINLKFRRIISDIQSATGWKTIEIHLKWRRIVSEIQGGEIDTDSIYNGFKEQLRLIWDHFLSTDCKLSCLSPNLSPHSYMRLCASTTFTSRNIII